MTIKPDNGNHDTEDNKESVNKIPDHGEGLMNVNQKSLSMFCKRKYVIIDVGGERFQADRNTFLRFPNTRLGRLMSCKTIEDILEICEEFIPGRDKSV